MQANLKRELRPDHPRFVCVAFYLVEAERDERLFAGNWQEEAVRRFTILNGLWMTAIVTAGMIAMLVLWLLGVFRLDAD